MVAYYLRPGYEKWQVFRRDFPDMISLPGLVRSLNGEYESTLESYMESSYERSMLQSLRVWALNSSKVAVIF